MTDTTRAASAGTGATPNGRTPSADRTTGRTGQWRRDRSRLPDPERFYEAAGLQLAGHGAWRTARCCFHDDRRPSLRINVENGGFYCPACDARGGDIIDFVMQHDGLSFVAAARALGALVGAHEHDILTPSQHAQRREALARRHTTARARAEAAQHAQWVVNGRRAVAAFGAALPWS